MSSSRVRATITGIGHYVPPHRVTNQDLEKIVDTSDDWIRTRTGIVERRVAGDSLSTADLAVKASRRALQDAGVDAADLDLVLVATASPDMVFPATGSLVQSRIGAVRAGACDISCGCAGFVYALAVAAQFIESAVYQRVLVVGSDTLTKLVDWTDRNTCVLFGDGAGAVVLEPAGNGSGILAFNLKSDGSGADLLQVPAGGSRRPASLDTVSKRLHYLKMAGGEVFRFAVKAISESTLAALEAAGFSVNDVDLFIPHQANARIIDAAARRIGIPLEKVYLNVARYGNTSCASIPLALSEAMDTERLRPGDLVVICGFGAGLSWGGTVLRWSHVRSRRVGDPDVRAQRARSRKTPQKASKARLSSQMRGTAKPAQENILSCGGGSMGRIAARAKHPLTP